MRNKTKDDRITCGLQNSPGNTTEITGLHMVELCLELIETIFLKRLQVVKCHSQQVYHSLDVSGGQLTLCIQYVLNAKHKGKTSDK